MNTAIITSDTSINHLTGNGHPERPERIITITEKLKKRNDLNALADCSNEHVSALIEFN